MGLDIVVASKSAAAFGSLANNTTGGKFDKGDRLQTWILQSNAGKPGDLDGDGDVDLDDFVILKNAFGVSAAGDCDGDGDTDLDDFVILKNNFGTGA